MEKKSKEFEERSALIKLQRAADLEKHEMKMKALEFSRENNKLFHERELERGRIKWAEMRKNYERKDYYQRGRHGQ